MPDAFSTAVNIINAWSHKCIGSSYKCKCLYIKVITVHRIIIIYNPIIKNV